MILARHGDTDYTESGIIQGTLDPPLNARGTNAAIELSDFLAPTPIDIVMASELKRSYQFAEPTAIRFGIPVLKEPMLNERYWGSVQGRHYSKINTGGLTLENFLYFTNDVTTGINDGDRISSEPIAKVKRRIKELKNRLFRNNPNSTVFMSLHEYVLSYLLDEMISAGNGHTFYKHVPGGLTDLRVDMTRWDDETPIYTISVFQINFYSYKSQQKII